MTTFAYEFHNNQVTKKTATLPAVPTAQNGANVTNTIVEDFDEYGYLIKHTDERGVMTVYEWNVEQGQMTKELKNYINPSTYIPVDYEYDNLGRLTKETKTVGSIQQVVRWVVYDDLKVQALWQYYGGSPADREKVVYGFDRASNRLWRQNAVAGTGQDEYYTYDSLFQIKTLDRGTLNGGKTGITGTPSWEEDWSFDETGNWRGSSTGYLTKVSGTTTLNQNRTHNVANEITGITETVGGAWTTPAYDGNGNGTQVPRPLALTSGFDLKYDAWNRLVEVKNTGGSVVATYRYDGIHRRVTSLVGGNTRHYYFSLWWQVVEERVNSGSTAERSFVWGLRYLDDLVLRQKSSERLYALHDYYSVTAIVNTSGSVLERYGYDGFGSPRFMNASFGSASSSYTWETLYGAYRYDADTGLYQVRYRFLHSKLGRWLSRDPIGDKAGPNLYCYVLNRAVNEIDWRGLEIIIDPRAPQSFKDRMEECICVLYSSPAGRRLIDSLDGDVTIVPVTRTDAGPPFAGEKTIGLDPNSPNGIAPNSPARDYPEELPPDDAFGCAVVLAHELGHTDRAGGHEDEWDEEGYPTGGDNVSRNENPVREDLGIPLRENYHGYPVAWTD